MVLILAEVDDFTLDYQSRMMNDEGLVVINVLDEEFFVLWVDKHLVILHKMVLLLMVQVELSITVQDEEVTVFELCQEQDAISLDGQ